MTTCDKQKKRQTLHHDKQASRGVGSLTSLEILFDHKTRGGELNNR